MEIANFLPFFHGFPQEVVNSMEMFCDIFVYLSVIFYELYAGKIKTSFGRFFSKHFQCLFIKIHSYQFSILIL